MTTSSSTRPLLLGVEPGAGARRTLGYSQKGAQRGNCAPPPAIGFSLTQSVRGQPVGNAGGEPPVHLAGSHSLCASWASPDYGSSSVWYMISPVMSVSASRFAARRHSLAL